MSRSLPSTSSRRVLPTPPPVQLTTPAQHLTPGLAEGVTAIGAPRVRLDARRAAFPAVALSTITPRRAPRAFR